MNQAVMNLLFTVNLLATSWLILQVLAKIIHASGRLLSHVIVVEGSVPHLLSFLVYCLCFSFHRLITNISLCELPLYGGCVISAP